MLLMCAAFTQITPKQVVVMNVEAVGHSCQGREDTRGTAVELQLPIPHTVGVCFSHMSQNIQRHRLDGKNRCIHVRKSEPKPQNIDQQRCNTPVLNVLHGPDSRCSRSQNVSIHLYSPWQPLSAPPSRCVIAPWTLLLQLDIDS
jgi:hypothetical protein